MRGLHADFIQFQRQPSRSNAFSHFRPAFSRRDHRGNLSAERSQVRKVASTVIHHGWRSSLFYYFVEVHDTVERLHRHVKIVDTTVTVFRWEVVRLSDGRSGLRFVPPVGPFFNLLFPRHGDTHWQLTLVSSSSSSSSSSTNYRRVRFELSCTYMYVHIWRPVMHT